MSIWTTKSLEKDRKYIVLKHNIPNANYKLNGIRFRGGYCVVEKDSKSYYSLLKIPVLKNAKEFPLTFLRKLPFITKSHDVKLVYGQDVFVKFLQAEAEQKIEDHKTDIKFCKSTTVSSGELCNNELVPGSPSGYCKVHLLMDPKLPELGFEIPRFLTKQEKIKLRDKIARQLAKL